MTSPSYVGTGRGPLYAVRRARRLFASLHNPSVADVAGLLGLGEKELDLLLWRYLGRK